MSDNLEMLVDVEVDLADADQLRKAVVARFRKLGLITGRLTRDCALGGKGYRPGPAVRTLYQPGKGECPFWEYWTCGVVPHVGRGFNDSATGPSLEWVGCPKCDWRIRLYDEAFDEFDDSLSAAIRAWLEQTGSIDLRCPGCSKKSAVTKWLCQPPMGFGNLSFTFWNWPSFDAPGWKIDIRKVVEDVTQHKIVTTYGHL